MNFRKLIFLLLLVNMAAAQNKPQAEKPLARSTTTLDLSSGKKEEIDIQAIVKETEFVDSRNHKMGLFWWVPVEFWRVSLYKQGYSAQEAEKAFAPFKRYNLFLVAVGDMGFGNIIWQKAPEIRGHLLLHDNHGNTYKPVEEMPEDVAPIVEAMKPVLKNLMGNLGDGIQFFLFPAKDSAGTVFADPYRSSEMTLDVSEIMGTPSSTYTWRLPLSSINPPRFCPVGKERVEASWKYCPWHGNKLEDPAAPSAMPGTPTPSGK